MKRKYVAGAILAMLLLAIYYLYGGGHVPPGQEPLRSINANNVAEFRNEFNAARDDVRVLLLLSPT